MEPRLIIAEAHTLGAVVPFSATKLKFTRVRRGYEAQLEAVLPSLVGGRETYVMPLTDLNRLFPLPLYDRLMLEEIMATEGITPFDMRAAALRLDSEGARGREARRRADETAAAARLHEVQTYFAALEQLRSVVAPMMPIWGVEAYDLKNAETHVRINAIVEAAAKRFKLQKRDVVAKLELLARLAACVVAAGRSRGHLLETLFETRHFVTEMAQQRLGGSVELQEMLSYIRLAGRETEKLVTPMFQKVDDIFQSVDAFLQKTKDLEAALTEWIEAISWGLDGWRSVIDHWLSGSQHTQLKEATLEQMAPNLPFLPLTIFAKAGRDKNGRLEQQRASLNGKTVRIAAGEVDHAMLDLLRSRGALAGAMNG